MKANFKPLGLAAAVAAASAGFAGSAAAEVSANGLGDLALIPYYSVQGDFVTGVHITNTSERTQVVKLRFRRASDSMDALDLNVVLSPKDVFTGFIDDSSGNLLFSTDDKSCTVPAGNAGEGKFQFPDLYREGAEEGYIEVIAMGHPVSETMAIAQAAKHTSEGVPLSCDRVRDNFFSQYPGLATRNYGYLDNDRTTQQWWADADLATMDPAKLTIFTNTYEATENDLRVSYFIRDAASGLEFGNDAVHIEEFSDVPMMTNQQYGLFSGDISGFDYPDLNGGVPDWSAVTSPQDFVNVQQGDDRDRFNDVIRPDLGVASVLNDWSTASSRNVATDWVVTFPGQYTMLDYYFYTVGIVAGGFGGNACGTTTVINGQTVTYPECDFRDLPVLAQFSGANAGTYDREEFAPVGGGGDLVVSPSVPGEVPTTRFEYEVNVVEWTDNSGADSVLGSEYAVSVDTSAFPNPYGWAQLAVSTGNTATQAVCDWPIDGTFTIPGTTRPLPSLNCTYPADGGVPMIGFVAWERSFPSDPSANYGRIVEHASTTSSLVAVP